MRCGRLPQNRNLLLVEPFLHLVKIVALDNALVMQALKADGVWLLVFEVVASFVSWRRRLIIFVDMEFFGTPEECLYKTIQSCSCQPRSLQLRRFRSTSPNLAQSIYLNAPLDTKVWGCSAQCETSQPPKTFVFWVNQGGAVNDKALLPASGAPAGRGHLFTQNW